MKSKVTCGYCKKNIKKNSKKCPHCSKEFKIFKKQEKETTTEEKKKSWFANNWGAFVGAFIGLIYGFFDGVEHQSASSTYFKIFAQNKCTGTPQICYNQPIISSKLYWVIVIIIGFLIGWLIHFLIRKLIKKIKKQ